MKLSDYIKTHQKEFDTAVPEIGHEERFKQKLNCNASHSLKRSRVIIAIAAAMAALLLIPLFVLLPNQPKHPSDTKPVAEQTRKEPQKHPIMKAEQPESMQAYKLETIKAGKHTYPKARKLSEISEITEVQEYYTAQLDNEIGDLNAQLSSVDTDTRTKLMQDMETLRQNNLNTKELAALPEEHQIAFIIRSFKNRIEAVQGISQRINENNNNPK